MTSDRQSAGWSLRKGLLLSYGLATLLLFTLAQGLIVFGVPHTVFIGLWARQHQEAIRDISAMADGRKSQLESWVFERHGDLRTHAESPLLQGAVQKLVQQTSALEAEVELKRLRQYLHMIQDSYYGEYAKIEIIGADSGRVLVSTWPEEEGRDASQTCYFRKAMNPSVEEVVIKELAAKSGQVSELVFARAIHGPVEQKTALPDAVLVLHNPMERITRSLLHEGIGRTGEIVLVDQEARLMAPLRYPLADGSVAQPLAFVLSTKAAGLAAQGVETIVESQDYRGVEVLAATRHLRVTSELAWGLVVKKDASEVLQPIRQSFVAHALVLAGALFAGGVLIVLIATRLTRPLAALSRAAAAIAAGDLSVRTEPDGSRELRDLSRSFNSMVARLEHWHQDLGAEVEKRTAELSAAHQALLASEERYRRIVETSDEGIWVGDEEYRTTFVNSRLTEMLGYPAQEMLGRPVASFIAEEDQPLHHEQEALRRKGQSLRYERRFRHQDGSTLWAMVSASPILGEQGEFVGALAMVSDISEQKRMADALSENQARLNQAQKMEAIGTLAGGIAHDFNNILAAILGYADLAKDDAPPGSHFAHDIDRILTAGHRARDLVKQILAFSRQASVDRIPIKIQPLIKEALKMLRASIPTTIEIKGDIHPQCGAIIADPTQIHQIIMNLCTNAFHAMEKDGGVLGVTLSVAHIAGGDDSAARQLAAGDYVELAVTDTGTGIGPDVIDRIFDPYFTTKEFGKGTGMGLSITHGIVKSYGGAVTVESVLGQGTAFHVYLPMAAEQELEEKGETVALPTGREHILFIDDEEFVSELGQSMLERLGYRVTVRRSSFEALEVFMNDPGQFDLVVTDQTMPGMTGIDLARRMMQIRPDIPVILCTGYSNLIDEDSAKAMGIRGFAFKPLAKKDLAQLIREVFEGGTTRP